MNNNPIGVFDSGIGGLTVVKAITEKLPHESIIYLGDTARVPYGTRSKEIITKFALDLAQFLIKRKVKFLVVACNTISAVAYDAIKNSSPVPIIGVITPAVIQASRVSKNGKIGVIGTVGTIKSDTYGKLIRVLNPDAEVYSVACPLFVPLAEEGFANNLISELATQEYLKSLKKAKVDTLILGCTHYPILYKVIQREMGNRVNLVDSSHTTAEMLEKRLKNLKLLGNNTHPKWEFYVTDAPERVYQVAGRFFGEALNGKLKKISLSE
ncbi:MAG: glutamate racemase [Candidatus Daviesbacteria bacterium]|nr:glutamate racemase [Candidatus Daviesbacteria bacterium]